ncbi:MAG: energy-coupling factor transporter ATPase [Bacillaceae bacterium]|nr:energy-coupling factor transporter ATPase [Bacillaceae bacterium]
MDKETVTITNLNATYDTSDKPVLKDINLAINQGEWISICGHNGSGKSTLGKFINGLLIPKLGEVIICGKNTKDEENLLSIRRKAAMVFQNPDNQFVGPTVEDDIAFGLENMGVAHLEMVKRVKKSIKEMGLEGLETSEPYRLSGGQKQRVALAGAMAMEPEIIILDEATTMLDPTSRSEVMKYIQRLREEHNTTLIMITHNLNEAALSDRLILLSEGHIIADSTPHELLQDKELLAKAGLKQPFIYEIKNLLELRGVPLRWRL